MAGRSASRDRGAEGEPQRVMALASLLRTQGRELESRVTGASMGATLPTGTPIRIQLSKVDQVGPGDVVAFVSGRHLVVHRIVSRGRRGAARDFWIMRGDAHILPDPPVARGAVLGPVRIAASPGGPDELRAVPPGPPSGWLARCAMAGTRALLELSVEGTYRLIVVLALVRALLLGSRVATAEVPGTDDPAPGAHRPS